MARSMLLSSAFLALLLPLSSSTWSARTEPPATAVLTLDADNFSEVIAAHQFIVVNFYAPWLYWSKKLAPEYEKAAAILRDHDPPIVLAKINAIIKKNIDFTKNYGVVGYPTVKIFRNGGSTVQQYFGERDAESIVQYLKKQVGPASTEIQSAEGTASSTITDGNGKGKLNDVTLEPYHKSNPTPEVSEQPVKEVAANNLNDVVSNSAKKGILMAAPEAVLTLDADNISEVVAAHQFIFVDFYAPWCYWSKKLAPEYEKAAAILRNHDPPIVLAKIDASGENKKGSRLRHKYGVQGYPTVKLFVNGVSTVQPYFGERDAESIVQYLKKQVGAASTEIKSAEDAARTVTDGNDKGKAAAIPFVRSGDERIRDFKDQPVKEVAANNLNDVISNSKKVLLELRQRMKWAFQILVATIVELFTKLG
ncbi:unnamed protein product [Urochloa humidicola]